MVTMRSSIVLFIIFHFHLKVFSQLGKPCVTPNSENAHCFPLYKCHQLSQKLQKFLNASICGSLNSTEPLVCCGLLGDYKTIDYASLILDTLPLTVKIDELLPPKSICGHQTSQDRIFGGHKTSIDEFPWMALMEYRNKYGDSTGFQCGGVLISSRYVLTAAHCVVGTIEKLSGQLFSVRLGEYDLSTEADCEIIEGEPDCADPPKNYFVEEIVVHPEHTKNTSGIYNDIALIRLVEDVNFTDFIRPICLPLDQEKSTSGEKLYVAGWGRIENGTYSEVKLKVDLNTIETTVCSKIYSIFNISLSGSEICALGETGKDACAGDSGGPLQRTFPNLKDTWYVEGLVSFGPTKCAQKYIPGVYTRITQYIDWIIENMKM